MQCLVRVPLELKNAKDGFQNFHTQSGRISVTDLN